MIYTRLAGGLGNQLFQFAASLALRGESGAEVLLCTDGLRRYNVKRNFDLLRILHLPDGCHTDASEPVLNMLEASLLRLRIGRLLPKYGVNDRNFKRQLTCQTSGEARQPLWLDGYFQHGWLPPSFENVHEEMRSLLREDLPISRAWDAECVIHIRGGDFLTSEEHRVTSVDYYLLALAKLRASMPSLQLITVVTDDAVYAEIIVDCLRRAQHDLKFTLAPAPDSAAGAEWLQDFVLLRDARTRIIGNSSFAWWAAALDLRRATTVSPSRWTKGVIRDLFLPWEIDIPIDR